MITFAAALWFTFYGLGYCDRRVRLGVTLLAAAATFWLQPVVRTIYLGQINLILMAAIMWDLTQPDHTTNGKYRWWKGVATGIAAGIKLTPLIFIPYLLVTRKWREAAGCVGGFLATVVVGFVVLPHDSSKWWLHGVVISDGNRTGFVGWAGNQSLRAHHHPARPGRSPARADHLADRLRAGGHSRHRRRLPARPGGLPGARDPGHRADRAAGLADQLGPPLGLDRARHRRRRPLRDRRVATPGRGRRGLALGGGRGDDLHLTTPGRTRSSRTCRTSATSPSACCGLQKNTNPLLFQNYGDQPWYVEYHWHGFQLIWGNAYILGGMALLLFLLAIAFRLRNATPPPELSPQPSATVAAVQPADEGAAGEGAATAAAAARTGPGARPGPSDA